MKATTKKSVLTDNLWSRITRPRAKNCKPMVTAYTADGILAILGAVDKTKLVDNVAAKKGLVYMEALAAYLKSDAYRIKSEKQSLISQAWRSVNGQSRDRLKK